MKHSPQEGDNWWCQSLKVSKSIKTTDDNGENESEDKESKRREKNQQQTKRKKKYLNQIRANLIESLDLNKKQ